MATKTLCNGATCFCVTWHFVPSGAQATTEEKEVAADGGEGGCVELISCLSLPPKLVSSPVKGVSNSA